MQVLHLYTSPGHNFVGHHGQPAGQYPIIERAEACCLAGRGIEGDRYFDHQENFKGQITFFADEVYRALCEQFFIRDKPPSVFRRNVITRGVDLNSLVGREFAVQGVRFLGVEPCKPCYWMDLAFCPGAEDALKGRGGLRAKILIDGVLRVTQVPIYPEVVGIASLPAGTKRSPDLAAHQAGMPRNLPTGMSALRRDGQIGMHGSGRGDLAGAG